MHKFTREALYEKVWAKPMRTLAAEFGLSDVGLAKLCARHDIPRPPRGYWAKLAAGNRLTKTPLPASSSTSREIVIMPSEQVEPDRTVEAAIETTAAALEAAVTLPATLDDAHAKVKALVRAHKQAQAARRQEIKQRRHDWWRPEPLPDLTERDTERLKATSALFTAAETAGLKIADVEITGTLTFKTGRHQVELVLAERMRRGLKPLEGEAKLWSAFHQSFQAGLAPTGRLRAEIKTHLGTGVKTRWEETETKPIATLIPQIVGTLVAAAEKLDAMQREREERERRYAEARAREAEARRLRELDEARWKQVRERAAEQEEFARLQAFIASLKARLEADGDSEVDGQPVSAWIEWAELKAATLDPFREGLGGVFALPRDPWRYRY